MLVIIVCRDSKGRLSLRAAVDRSGCAHRHLPLETDWVTMALFWAAMMGKRRDLPFARLHPWFWVVGGLLLHYILSTEILDKTRSPLARDKVNGKFRPAPPKKSIKEEKMVRFALCTASSSIWGGGGLGFAVPFCLSKIGVWPYWHPLSY